MLQINKEKKDVFTSIITLIKGIVYEVDITFTPEKMIVKSIHASKSNMLFLELKKSFFSKFEIEKEITYTIDLDDLLKIIKVCKDDIYIEPGIDDIKIKSGRSRFKLKYFIGNKDERNLPVFDYTTLIKMKSKDFYEKVRDGLIFDAIGMFIIDEDKSFRIKMKNHKIESEMYFEEFGLIRDEKVETYFDLELLSLSMELEKLFEDVKIGFGKDVPLTLSCENDLIKADFVLANRVDDNE